MVRRGDAGSILTIIPKLPTAADHKSRDVSTSNTETQLHFRPNLTAIASTAERKLTLQLPLSRQIHYGNGTGSSRYEGPWTYSGSASLPCLCSGALKV